jgi:hypothetical protein
MVNDTIARSARRRRVILCLPWLQAILSSQRDGARCPAVRLSLFWVGENCADQVVPYRSVANLIPRRALRPHCEDEVDAVLATYPGFPVEVGGVGELHAAFFNGKPHTWTLVKAA